MPGLANALVAVAFAFATALAGCTVLPAHVLQTDAGRAALERGDSDRAVAEARIALIARPGYEPAQALLVQAFKQSVGTHTERIAAAKQILDWDKVVSEYRSMSEVDRLARPILSSSSRFSEVADLLVDRTDELDLALGLAAETHYQAGLVLGAEAAKAQKREAAREFSRAEGYIAPYKDALAKYASAREAGTEKVALVPFEDPSGSGAGRQIFESVQGEFGISRSPFEFVQFVPSGAAGADLAVRGRITDLSTQVSPIRDTYVHSRTQIVTGKSGKKKVLETEYRERSRTTTVRLAISMRILGSNPEIPTETLSAEASETQSWHEEDQTSDDDARLAEAIGQLVFSLLGKPEGPEPADTWALGQEAAASLAAKVRAWLSSYFTSL